MGLVTLRNINPLGQVDLPLIYRQDEPFGVEGAGCLEPGEEFEVSQEHAGWPPSGEAGDPDYIAGEGLLAQTTNYEHVSGDLLEPPAAGVPAGSIDVVLTWVGDDAARASEAIGAEQARPDAQQRKSLIAKLTALTEGDAR
jgi:hypothetical protein